MDLLQLDPTIMFLGVFFSLVGFGYYRYGKKQENKVAKYTGVALMIYPYFVVQLFPLVLIGILLMIMPSIIKQD